MNLEEAVAILNEQKHRGCDIWTVRRNFPDINDPVRAIGYEDDCLTQFEAEAIAEKYQREIDLFGAVLPLG